LCVLSLSFEKQAHCTQKAYSGGSKERGYISKNTKEVMEAYNCFQELKEYAKNLKEVLK
jgi:flavoprotein